jgi:hypothetical protein
MNKLCTQTVGGMVKPRKHEQRLLRNVGVHTVVLDLLQIPYDKKEDIRMNSLMRLAHEFLQNFCLGNQQNQVLLHKQLDLFLNPGVSRFICVLCQCNFYEIIVYCSFKPTVLNVTTIYFNFLEVQVHDYKYHMFYVSGNDVFCCLDS